MLARREHARGVTGGYFDVYAGGRLDPSGLVKGWAVEQASARLAAAGAPHTSVNGGGDVRLRGGAAPGRPWRVGLAHPLRRGTLVAVVEGGGDLAVATSGTAERGAHVLDPWTGRPAVGLAAVTVVGPELGSVDAYATAAFARGPAAREWLEGLPGHEGLGVGLDGGGWVTSGFPGRWVGTGATADRGKTPHPSGGSGSTAGPLSTRPSRPNRDA